MRPLTTAEQQFATENYRLIYGYLSKYPPPRDIPGYGYEDWYYVVAEALVAAVATWFDRKDLRDKCAFTTAFYQVARGKVRHVITMSRYQKRFGERYALNLGEPISSTNGSGESSIGMIIEDKNALCGESLDRILFDNSEQLLSCLEGREREIIELRLGLSGEEPMALRSIGEQMGVTRERIRQIEAKALKKLKKKIKLEEKNRNGTN